MTHSQSPRHAQKPERIVAQSIDVRQIDPSQGCIFLWRIAQMPQKERPHRARDCPPRLFAGAGLKQVLPVGCGRSAFQVLHRPLAWAPLAKPFSTRHEAIRKQWRSTKPRLATVSGHGAYSRYDLSRISQERPVDHADRGGTPMIEALAAVLAFTSIGIFLAHAFDAYRTR